LSFLVFTVFRDGAKKELLSLKQSYQDKANLENRLLFCYLLYSAYQGYFRLLKESNLCLEKDCADFRKKNEHLINELSHKDEALFALASEKSSEISDLRSELKMKAFELTTLRVALEVSFFLF
jgi:hypothetical protein